MSNIPKKIVLETPINSSLQAQQNITFYKKNYNITIEQIQLDIHCSLSRKVVKNPCRTSNCAKHCINQLQVLNACKVCGCGKQVDQENCILLDPVMKEILRVVNEVEGDRLELAKGLRYRVGEGTVELIFQ